MSPLIDYNNGIYAFDAGYVRPLLAAIHLIESEGRAAFVDTANFEVMPQALAELVQEVALVLAAVGAAQQPPAAAVFGDLRVVAGGDLLRAECARGVEEMLELDLAVA